MEYARQTFQSLAERILKHYSEEGLGHRVSGEDIENAVMYIVNNDGEIRDLHPMSSD